MRPPVVRVEVRTGTVVWQEHWGHGGVLRVGPGRADPHRPVPSGPPPPTPPVNDEEPPTGTGGTRNFVLASVDWGTGLSPPFSPPTFG